MVKGSASILLLLSLTLLVSSLKADDELVLTVEFCRHGARAPITYPLGKPILHDFEVGLGNLTPGGMRMHNLIGEQLRQTLITENGSLPSDYDINSMTVYADDISRTIQSAESQMYGLYPLGTGLKMGDAAEIARSIPPSTVEGLKLRQMKLGMNALAAGFAPIPVLHWTISQELSACPELEKLSPFKNPTLLKEAIEKILPYLPKFVEWTGISEEDYKKDPTAVVYAADVLACNYWAGYDIPNFDPTTDLQTVVEVLQIGLYFKYAATTEIARIRANPMVQPLKDLVSEAITGSSQRFVLFSGHDSDLAPLLKALGQPEYYPYFASTAFFQVWKKEESDNTDGATDSSDYYVTAKFNNEELKFNACSSDPCTAEEFVEFLGTVLVPDWDELCDVQSN